MWAKDQRAMEEARLDVSISSARRQGHFVLLLKDEMLFSCWPLRGSESPDLLSYCFASRTFSFFLKEGKLGDKTLD